jgi:LacI family transcriptional regulator
MGDQQKPKRLSLARPKLTDVAKLANVSLATASRALSQPSIVSHEVAERVRQAVEILGYTPDRTAKALSSGRSHTIGAVVPTLGTAIFADGVEALQERLDQLGYILLLSNSQYDPQKEFRQIRALLEQGVDGLVLVGDDFSPEVLAFIKKQNVPTLTTYICDSKNDLPAIGIDNFNASFKLTQYLLGLGHQRFGVIANTLLSNDRSQARLEGVVAALKETGLKLPRENLIEVERPTIVNGRRAFASLLAASAGVTAVMCTTDAMAVGAMAEAIRTGHRVPHDISITGFDNVEIAGELDPPLTTVTVPAAEIGRLAADQLVSAIEGHAIPQTTKLAAALIVRDSTQRVKPSK